LNYFDGIWGDELSPRAKRARMPTGSGGIATGGHGARVRGLVPGAPATSGRPPTPARYCSTGTVRSCAGRTTRPTPPLASRLQVAARDEPSFSGDDLVLWQVLRTSPSSWRSIRYTWSDPWFPGGRDRYRTCDLCRVNSGTGCFAAIRDHEGERKIGSSLVHVGGQGSGVL